MSSYDRYLAHQSEPEGFKQAEGYLGRIVRHPGGNSFELGEIMEFELEDDGGLTLGIRSQSTGLVRWVAEHNLDELWIES